MTGDLKPCLKCPRCGERVIGVFHEWLPISDIAIFEYFHAQRKAVRGRRYRRRACRVTYGYEQGQAQMKRETAA